MDYNITIEDPSFPILFKKGIVLLVGNNPKNQKSLKVLLKQMGAFVVFSTQEVFDTILETMLLKPNFIFIDLDPSEIEGIRAIQYIRSQPDFLRSHVIALSSETSMEKKAYSVGANQFLTKPLSFESIAPIFENHSYRQSAKIINFPSKPIRTATQLSA